VQVSHHLPRRVKLNGGFCPDVSPNDASPNDYGGNVDLRVHLGALANDQSVFTPDFSAEDSVDSDAPLEVKLPLEFGAAPEEGGDLGSRELRFHTPRALPGPGPGRQLRAAPRRATLLLLLVLAREAAPRAGP
jgi:hypothetical protein